MRRKSLTTLVLATFVWMATTAMALAWNYPADTGFADIPTAGDEELVSVFTAGKGLIVDVRSSIEYDIAHIKGAVNVKISGKDFVSKLQEEIVKRPGEAIYFYCNGPTCLKSPLATQTAIKAGITDCFSFYPGLPGWAEKHPEETILRGKAISATNKLITHEEYKSKSLAFEEFQKKANDDPNGMLIDIRDNIQRTSDLPGMTKKAVAIPLENFIPNFVQKKNNQDKTLYIFDQVGHQVEALQYDLVENGYTNYFFLQKGITAVIGTQEYKK